MNVQPQPQAVAAGSGSIVSAPTVAPSPARSYLGRILAGAVVMFVILQGGLTLLVPRVDQTSSALIVVAVMFGVAVLIERIAFGRDLRQGLLALGFGRPRPGALVAATIIGVAMLAFFPLYSAATGTPLALKADWLWVLLGAIVLNGLAEEALFRGFVFGHLRQGGHSFLRAGLISMAIFGAVHLFLFASNPFIVAFLATLLAISAALPFAFLYERAGRTIWAGVILHVAAHAFRLFDVRDDQMLTVGSAWILLQFGAVFLVFAFRNNLLRAPTPSGSSQNGPSASPSDAES
jgi:membrane protease YdiL (CAAX protease family)